MAGDLDNTVQKPKRTRTAAVPKNGLHEKIFNVQSDLRTVLKSGKHQHSGYDYSTERDFIAEVKPLLKRERLLVLPTTKSHIVVGMQHTVEVEYVIINVDNVAERTEPITFYGSGDDKQGSVVGLPIAYTMSLKYFLAKTFMAETGNDAESQTDEPAPTGKKAGARKAQNEDAAQATDTIKKMLSVSRNADGIRDYLFNKLEGITKLTAEQKQEIRNVAEERLNQLDAESEQQGGKAKNAQIQ